MDLLTTSASTDEQQELSARALRACLAAEAALASLRAECLPLQSLAGGAEAGDVSLELAHRSLQLQINACESFTLCATAAFKQLCDARFLPSGRKGASPKVVHTSERGSDSFALPCAHKSDRTTSQEDAGTGFSKVRSQAQIQEEAPTVFGNSLSSLMGSSDSEEAPGESRSPFLPNTSSFPGPKPSSSSTATYEKSGNSNYRCPVNSAGNTCVSSSDSGAAGVSRPMADSAFGSYSVFGSELNSATQPSALHEPPVCSSRKGAAESETSHTLSCSGSCFLDSGAGQARNPSHRVLLSSNDSTEGNRESAKGSASMFASSLACNTKTFARNKDGQLCQPDSGKGAGKTEADASSQPEWWIGHAQDNFRCCGSTGAVHHVFPNRDPPSPPTKSAFCSMTPRISKDLEPSSSPAAAQGHSGCANKPYMSTFAGPPAPMHSAGKSEGQTTDNNGDVLHSRTHSCAKPPVTDISYDYLSCGSDRDNSQDKNWNLAFGLGRRCPDFPGRNHVSPNQLSYTAASIAGPTAATYENGNAELVRDHRMSSATRADWNEQMAGVGAMLCSRTVEAKRPCLVSPACAASRPEAVCEPSRLATDCSGAGLPLSTSLARAEGVMKPSDLGSTLPSAKDLTNWQVVARLNAEFLASGNAGRPSNCHPDNGGRHQEERALDRKATWLEFYRSGSKHLSRCSAAGIVDSDSGDDHGHEFH